VLAASRSRAMAVKGGLLWFGWRKGSHRRVFIEILCFYRIY
jgi:hypothetical protein